MSEGGASPQTGASPEGQAGTTMAILDVEAPEGYAYKKEGKSITDSSELKKSSLMKPSMLAGLFQRTASQAINLNALLHEKMSYFQDNTLEETLAGLRVDPAVGLSNEEAKLRLETVGPNRLDADPPTPLWKIILEQFNDLLVILLMISCVVSMALGQYAAGTTILVIVTLNATLGVIMERRAGKALDALQSSSKTLCTVFREGKLIEDFESSELVPGDIVHLTMGSKAPADCRLIEDKKLKVDEASLTGESDPVAKKTLHGKHEEHKATDVEEGGEKKLNLEHMVYMSCNVLEGNGRGVVVKTGMNTCIGEIQKMIQSADELGSPLQAKLEKLGKQLGMASILVSLVVFAAGAIRGVRPDPTNDQSVYLQYLLIAVSLTVAAVPEGLPACVTITLAVGMQKMSHKKALIKNLYKVETLGSASVVCTDKTGTLTAGVQTAVRMWFNKTLYQFDKVGFDPEGSCTPSQGGQALTSADPAAFTGLVAILACNKNVQLSLETITSDKGVMRQEWQCTGNMSERPLIVAGRKLGITRNEEFDRFFPIRGENPFDSTRKMMSTLIELTPDGMQAEPSAKGFGSHKFVACVKGAPNYVLDQCATVSTGQPGGTEPMTSELRAQLDAQIDELSAKAYRVLAVAYKGLGSMPAEGMDGPEQLEKGLVLAGLFASIDPERPGVIDAIRRCKTAGVRVCMITGDYIKTAKAIAVNINLLNRNEPDETTKAIDCHIIRDLGVREATLLEKLNQKKKGKNEPKPKESVKNQKGGRPSSSQVAPSPTSRLPSTHGSHVDLKIDNDFDSKESDKKILAQIQEKIDNITKVTKVYARAKPSDKITIVRSFQRQGHIVSMTGDGVNDAPALQQANIGVAMGLAGTSVAKDAADMILTDDNFSSIIDAIEQGRTIYANIGKFVFFLLSTNVAEVLMMMIAVIVGYDAPLETVQILWLNLVTDGAPAVALAVELTEPTTMLEGPRNKKEALIEKMMLTGIAIHTCVLTLVTLLTFIYGISLTTGSWAPGRGVYEIKKGDSDLTKELKNEIYGEGLRLARTMTMYVIVMAELLRAYTSRSLRSSLCQVGTFSNKYMQYSVGAAVLFTALFFNIPGMMEVFQATYLHSTKHDDSIDAGWHCWVWVIAFSILPVILDEVLKMIYRKTGFGARPLAVAA